MDYNGPQNSFSKFCLGLKFIILREYHLIRKAHRASVTIFNFKCCVIDCNVN